MLVQFKIQNMTYQIITNWGDPNTYPPCKNREVHNL